jgi:hypothetical protein
MSEEIFIPMDYGIKLPDRYNRMPMSGGMFQPVDVDCEGYLNPKKRIECLKRMKNCIEESIEKDGKYYCLGETTNTTEKIVKKHGKDIVLSKTKKTTYKIGKKSTKSMDVALKRARKELKLKPKPLVEPSDPLEKLPLQT